MFDFSEGGEQHIPEPDLVPILDALTSVIFFLILSTTFMEYTKLTLPPSKTSVISDPQRPQPVSAKLFYHISNNKTSRVILKWAGANPDMISEQVERKDPLVRSAEIEKTIEKMVTQFKEQYPEEKTIQISFSSDSTYQEMINVMDGARTGLQDIVLVSAEEADGVSNGL